MRKTGPITQKEVTFGPDEQLVTSTTAKGVITFCNDDFCRIAGYSREELMGQAHNVVRHPDMPAAAFKAMWDNLKAGTPWMGLVKNRCANGDHYWVDAYVTPVRENGQVVGHESVRFAPTREQIERATYAYARLNKGQSAVPWLRAFWEQQKLTLGVFLLAWIAFKVCLTLADDFNWMTATLATVTSIVVATGTSWLKTLQMAKILEVSRSVVRDKLAAYIYTGRSDAYGEVLLAQYICQARIRTALGRFSESAKTLTNKSTAASDQAVESLKAMSAQQAESAQVAESMTQMTIAVQEVAAGVSATSSSAMDAMTQVKAGESVTLEASREINELSTMVERLSDVMGELSGGSEKIASVIDVIRSIADQTNLLALNAAIEAARAGEQGRGFSVVADEVRSLAQRTQESTQSIQEIIESLGKSTGQAADNMATCRERSHRSVESIGKVDEALTAISRTAASIERQTQQMAAAAEEQSAVAVEVDKNVKNISEISTSTQGLAEDTAKLSNEMRELSDVQFNLIDRFK